MAKEKEKRGKTSVLVAVVAALLVAVFLARRSVGVSTLTAFADAFTVSGGAVSLPPLLAYLYAKEGADGLSYAARRGLLGILPFFGKEESYREYKARRREKRTSQRWDLTAVKVGGVLCLTGLTFAFLGIFV